MPPLIWAFVSDHAGDNAQVLALAEELGLPFETRPLFYTWRKRIPGNDGRVSLFSLDRRSRVGQIAPPWPDLILLVGPRPQPVARTVKKLSGGRTKLVLIGRPRTRTGAFDLIFDTRQYLLPDAPNLHLLPVAISQYRTPMVPTDEERGWLDSLPRPHLLLMIGGPVRYWHMWPRHIGGAVDKLLARAAQLGGSLIVAGSPRTPRAILARVRHDIASAANGRLAEIMPRFQVLVEDAEELFPTGDSVSMISESVITGKPVGIIPLEPTLWGRIGLGSKPRTRWNPYRDLRRFWNHLWDERLAGTVDEPIAGKVSNPVVAAVREVRELLGV